MTDEERMEWDLMEWEIQRLREALEEIAKHNDLCIHHHAEAARKALTPDK